MEFLSQGNPDAECRSDCMPADKPISEVGRNRMAARGKTMKCSLTLHLPKRFNTTRKVLRETRQAVLASVQGREDHAGSPLLLEALHLSCQIQTGAGSLRVGTSSFLMPRKGDYPCTLLKDPVSFRTVAECIAPAKNAF